MCFSYEQDLKGKHTKYSFFKPHVCFAANNDVDVKLNTNFNKTYFAYRVIGAVSDQIYKIMSVHDQRDNGDWASR